MNDTEDHSTSRVHATSGSARDMKTERLDAAVRSLPRRRFFDDMPDKGLFAAFAVTGFAGIIILKIWDFDPTSVLGAKGAYRDYIAWLAVALMIAYGAIAYRIPAVQIRLDRLGDNFYYLGFIYTLASLSAALMQLRTGVEIETLLGSFGVALFTTIVGVSGRVLFVQMRGELDEVEERVRRDLLSASVDLRTQLSLSLREFETFHTGVLQAASETLSKSTDIAKSQIDQIATVANATADRIQIAFESSQSQARTLTDLVMKLSKAVDEAVDRLNSKLGEFGDELQSLLDRLGNTLDDIALRSAGRKRRRWYWPFRRR